MESLKLELLRVRVAVIAAVALSIVNCPVAYSEELGNQTNTVLERERPEFDPLGVRISSFVMSPTLEVKLDYDDNVLATQNNKRDDLITIASPGVVIASDWNQHSLRVQGRGKVARYASNGAEDHENFEVGADGRIDIQRDFQIVGAINFESASESRGSVDDAGGRNRTEFSVLSLQTGLKKRWNRGTINVSGGISHLDFDDVPTGNGSAIINNDDRDRNEYQTAIRGGYDIQDEYEAFIEVRFDLVEYRSSRDDNGVSRDSFGYEVRAGSRVDITGLLFGDIFLGYLDRDYTDTTLASIDAFVAGLALTWNITPLTTIKAGFSREVAETTLATASGSLLTSGRLSVDHELLRSLIVSANSSFVVDSLEGSAREDDNFSVGFSLKYLLNRNLSLKMGYEYTQRDSNVANADYDKNLVMFSITGKL